MTLFDTIEEAEEFIEGVKRIKPQSEWGIRKAPPWAKKKYQVYRKS